MMMMIMATKLNKHTQFTLTVLRLGSKIEVIDQSSLLQVYRIKKLLFFVLSISNKLIKKNSYQRRVAKSTTNW